MIVTSGSVSDFDPVSHRSLGAEGMKQQNSYWIRKGNCRYQEGKTYKMFEEMNNKFV